MLSAHIFYGCNRLKIFKLIDMKKLINLSLWSLQSPKTYLSRTEAELMMMQYTTSVVKN